VSTATRSGWLPRGIDPAEAIVVVVRFGVLGLCVLLSLLSQLEVPTASLVMLGALAIAVSIPLPNSWVTRWRPLLEAAVAAAIIGATPALSEPLLPYLVVPPLAAGLISGALVSTLTALISLVVLVLLRGRSGDLTSRTEVTLIAEWIGLGLATGLVGAWARSVATREGQATSTYVAAHRLLTRLRDVARALPTGLD